MNSNNWSKNEKKMILTYSILSNHIEIDIAFEKSGQKRVMDSFVEKAD